MRWLAWSLLEERGYAWGWSPHPMWGAWGLGGMAVMLLMMLLFWGLVIAALIAGIRWLIRQGRGGTLAHE